MNIKVKKIIIFSILIAFVCAISFVVFKIVSTYSEVTGIAQAMAWEYKITGFERHEEDFDETVKILYSKYNEDPVGEHCYYLDLYNFLDYIKEPPIEIEVTKEEKMHLDKVYNSFKSGNGSLNAIWVDENRITFTIECGAYALIYTKDGSEPTYVNSPDEGKKGQFEKINSHWYHAAFKP